MKCSCAQMIGTRIDGGGEGEKGPGASFYDLRKGETTGNSKLHLSKRGGKSRFEGSEKGEGSGSKPELTSRKRRKKEEPITPPWTRLEKTSVPIIG